MNAVKNYIKKFQIKLHSKNSSHYIIVFKYEIDRTREEAW